MSTLITGDRTGYVSSGNIGSLLASIAATPTDSNAGLFGPGSITWRINRESAVFLGAGRAALLQLAHPWVMAALADHSNLLNRPIARFHNTFRIVFTMVFGSVSQAMAAARYLHSLHTHIRGELKEEAGQWPRGAHYEANEIGALRWVYATLVESALMGYECAVAPLTDAEHEQYYAESRTFAALFGLPASALPADWSAFAESNRQMHASNELAVTDAARAYAARLLSGAGSWLRSPAWFRALTAAWMPPQLRVEFFPEYGPEEQRAAAAAARRVPRMYRHLPAPIRYVGPWRQAQARLAHRSPGLAAHMSNRFWIGAPEMPFAEEAALRTEPRGTTIAE
jgi:uncharacterized protein (DUF2236 family)